MPWYIGIVVILVSMIFIGFGMWAGNCPAPAVIELGVLVLIPFVYLVLMYLTFTSQD